MRVRARTTKSFETGAVFMTYTGAVVKPWGGAEYSVKVACGHAKETSDVNRWVASAASGDVRHDCTPDQGDPAASCCSVVFFTPSLPVHTSSYLPPYLLSSFNLPRICRTTAETRSAFPLAADVIVPPFRSSTLRFVRHTC
jgi:hypothetical protein